jgi:hypothetical protein
MPTGYTEAIKDDITFKQYALGCARAFIYEMRDSNAPIPERFELDTHHAEALAAAQARLTQLLYMSAEDAELEAAAEFKRALATRRAFNKKSDTLRAKYEAMLVAVDCYKSPTPKHADFKEFMRDQIIKSIKGDCFKETTPVRLSGYQWLERELSAVHWQEAYYAEQSQKEIKRVEEKNQWVAALRESLEGGDPDA